MLSNLIGIVVAFITVMLLLSLVVMALVQLTQSLLRLRARNLLVGISALLQAEGLADDKTDDTKEPAKDRVQSERPRASGPANVKAARFRKQHALAAVVLNATTAAKLRPVDDPNN